MPHEQVFVDQQIFLDGSSKVNEQDPALKAGTLKKVKTNQLNGLNFMLFALIFGFYKLKISGQWIGHMVRPKGDRKLAY